MSDNPPSTAKLFGHPLHPMLVPFPIACFVGALLTDLAYWSSADMQWANFSIWLITFGLIFGALAALTGMIDFASSGRVRAQRPAWPHMLGNVLAMLLSLVNAFVHSRDAWTSVVPTGLTLSAIVVVILMGTSWLGGSLVYKHKVGVQN